MRLQQDGDIEIVGVVGSLEELDGLLSKNAKIDVLIMGVEYLILSSNSNRVFAYLQKIQDSNFNLKILAVSALKDPAVVRAMVESGFSGYVFKDDSQSIRDLYGLVKDVARGERRFSKGAQAAFDQAAQNPYGLTQRQLDVLFACAAHPDLSLDQLAADFEIASSTLRNTLSEIYARLEVHNKAAALIKAKRLGIIP